MSFYAQLQDETLPDQQQVFASIGEVLANDFDLGLYQEFLVQAYHHVRHTVPLLMATGARLGPKAPWVQAALCNYITEEQGHEQWILNDLLATGAPAEIVETGPQLPCELMVSHAYDLVGRGNPMAFFGMVHVLEGTSAMVASQAAGTIGSKLSLPAQAFSYLTSHGALDQEHVQFFAGLMDQVTDAQDQRDILHSSHVFFRLYGDMFRTLDRHTVSEP